jgi:hypothetical protein
MPQEQVRLYKVIYKGDEVGTLRFKQLVTGDSVHYKMSSDVQTRFIFRIHVKSTEEAVFKNGKLLYSAVNRTVNGNEKVRRQTLAANNVYHLKREGKASIFNNANIQYNLIRLYSMEPVNINKVYSDNFQQYLPVIKAGAHKYKVELPDGNYNYYTYNNGICSKVDVHHSLYTMQMILR